MSLPVHSRQAASVDDRAMVNAIVKVRREVHDQRVDSLVRCLEGKPGGYSGLRAAYADATGNLHVPANFVDAMLGAEGAYDSRRSVNERLTESLTTSSWSNVLGDALHRRLVAEYQTTPGLQAWRYLVSNQSFNVDFRNQRMEKIGGYGLLPTVAQGAPYNPLPSPANDSEATYAISKKGGTEDLTLETFASDDVGAVRRIITTLARAAANTLNRAVLDLLVTNAAIYDGVVLFHASHNNLTATPLNTITLDTLRIKMRKQAHLGDANDVLGVVPRFIIVPPELEQTALALLDTYNAQTISTLDALHEPLDLIVAAHYASATGWYLAADPASSPTIEVGFSEATSDPAMIIQGPDTQMGSAYTSDKVTLKLRHPWGIGVPDFRGLAKGN